MKVTSNFMTLIGAIAAGITTAIVMLPDDVPYYISVILASISSVLSVLLGVTSKDTRVPGTSTVRKRKQ